MSPLLSTTPIHDIEVVLFQSDMRLERQAPARRQELMALLLARGRLPMLARRRGR